MHKPIPMRQAMKIPDAKAAVDKEWDKLKKLPAWPESKVKSKQEVGYLAGTERRKDSSFAKLRDLCHLKKF